MDRARVTRRALSLSAALLITGGAGSPMAATAPLRQTLELGAQSPEAVVARMRAAAEARDVRELAACVDPESRRHLAEGLYVAGTLMVAFAGMMPALGEAMGEMAGDVAEAMGAQRGAEQTRQQAQDDPQLAEAKAMVEQMTARFNEIAARHGLPTLDAGEQGDADPEVLETAFANVDHLALIGDLGDFLESLDTGNDPSPVSSAIPEGELMDLERQGDRATGRIGDETLEFVRLDGRWFARLDADSIF